MEAYDSTMAQSAAFLVLDYLPDEEDMEELVMSHLDTMDLDEAQATVDIVYEAPDWMTTSEQDQINAHMRDGSVCIVVLYISVGEDMEIDLDDDD